MLVSPVARLGNVNKEPAGTQPNTACIKTVRFKRQPFLLTYW